MLPSVNVIYFKIDHKLIPTFYHKQNKRKNVLEGSGKIYKFKKMYKSHYFYNPS